MRSTTYMEVYPELIEATREMLRHLPGSVDTTTQHWERTPERFARYLTHLGRRTEYDRWTSFVNEGHVRQLVIVPGIPFWSACTHHLLPFVGTVDFGYVPMDHIMGLSKIPLLIRDVAKGFWMQEDLAAEVARRFQELVKPYGIAIRIKAQHTCQLLDVGPPIPWMITTELHGVLLHNPSAKEEFLDACHR